MSATRHLEYEKRFQLNNEQIEALKAMAAFDFKITTVDEMWDTDDFSMDDKELCLRRRNGQWELKVPLPGHSSDMACREEVTDTKRIAQLLTKDESCTDITEALEREGIKHQGTATGQRKIYRYENMAFDFSNFTFQDTPVPVADYNNIVEIEIVLSENDGRDPVAEIKSFAQKQGLEWTRTRGKFSYLINQIKLGKEMSLGN